MESLRPSHIKTISNPSYSFSTKMEMNFGYLINSNSNMKEDSVSAASSRFMTLHECNCKKCESSSLFTSKIKLLESRLR